MSVVSGDGALPRRLLASFSGGETSAYMTQKLLREAAHEYDEIVIAFSNTGEERKECLEFVHECDERLFAPLGHRVIWVEAVIHHGEKKGPTHRIVTFETASRKGEPFREFVRKYGIPNPKFPACSRALKRYPIMSLARSMGWATNTYDTAIGIRADEIDRMTEDKHLKRVIYPLAKRWPTTKPQINFWFTNQPFRLRLKGYQGNCKTCWKKSFRKLLTIWDEGPEDFAFNREMEAEFGLHGAEFAKEPPPPCDYRRVFFRGNRSVADIEQMRAEAGDSFVTAEDDTQNWEFSFDLDVGGGCGESCEIWADDDGSEEFDIEELAA